MSEPATQRGASSPLLPGLLPLCRAALDAADRLGAAARAAAGRLVLSGGRVDAAALERDQFAAHAYAWFATYVEALRQALAWAERLDQVGALGELESLMLQAGFGEYLAQLAGGIALAQGEIARPADLGIGDSDLRAFQTDAVRRLIAGGNSSAARQRIAELIASGAGHADFGKDGLDDETLALVREQFRRFA